MIRKALDLDHGALPPHQTSCSKPLLRTLTVGGCVFGVASVSLEAYAWTEALVDVQPD